MCSMYSKLSLYWGIYPARVDLTPNVRNILLLIRAKTYTHTCVHFEMCSMYSKVRLYWGIYPAFVDLTPNVRDIHMHACILMCVVCIRNGVLGHLSCICGSDYLYWGIYPAFVVLTTKYTAIDT
jgi:hypothetical protein